MATVTTSLSVSSITNDRLTGTLNDGNASGANLNNSAAFLQAFKVDYTSNETSITVTPTGAHNALADPDHTVSTGLDSTWTFPISMDGWFKFRYLVAPIFVPLTSYNQYDIVYDETGDGFYQANAAYSGATVPSAVPGTFTRITDLQAVFVTIGTATEPGNITYQDFDTIIRVNTNKRFGDVTAKAALELCGDCTRSEDVEAYELLGVFVDGMVLANNRSQFVDGEKIARRAERVS